MYRFGLRVGIQSIRPQFAANARRLVSTKWDTIVRITGRVYPYHTSLELPGYTVCSRNLFGEESCCKAVGGVIGFRNGLCICGKLAHNHNRAKNFFFDNA